MPGVTARSANKNVSRAKQAAFNKNNARVEAALTEDLEGYCTFGKISKNFGYGRFLVLNSDKREHICTMRGSIAKAIRPSVDDVVLLSIRDYETRANGADAVYDIIASFDKKAVAKLIKSKTLPRWMNGKVDDADKAEEDDIFDYSDDDESDSSENEQESNIVSKKDKKNHRSVAAGGGTSAADDSDVDIDAI
jgi:translation initiation factor IF-1